ERPATVEEQRLLSRWSSWGAVPEIFDEAREEWARDRAQLRGRLGEQGWAAARRTTLNAHYTHPQIVAAMWELTVQLCFEHGRVLEPGCGAGVFIGLAPVGAEMTGVELDNTTAAIAQRLYPHAQIHAGSFAAGTRMADGSFDLTIGNVPFGDVRLHDPRHNPGATPRPTTFSPTSRGRCRPPGASWWCGAATTPSTRRTPPRGGR